MGEPIEIEHGDGGRLYVLPPDDTWRHWKLAAMAPPGSDDIPAYLRFTDTQRRRLIEALGGVVPDEPAWTGKTDPLPGTQNQAVSLVALELPPGTEIEVYVRRPR